VSLPSANLNRTTVAALLLLGGLALAACSDAKRPSSVVGSGGNGSGARPGLVHGGGDDAVAGDDAGGSDGTSAGERNSSAAGNGTHSGGVSEGGGAGTGVAGSSTLGGAGTDPIPPEGDPPLCAHGRAFAAGTLLALSAAGDDVLQAVTPDELTLAWKNGEHFYVADWDGENGVFGAPVEVAGSAQYRSIALSSDGLQLIGIKHDLTVVEQTRSALQPFADAAPGAGDFQDFNLTRASIPVANQELGDAVLGPDDSSFFFSHYTTSYMGSNATLFESRRSGGVWNFTSSDLGKLLYADDQKRRIPTGISSDALTLFYVDQVEGDFRAAWRVNTQVAFDYSEVLNLADGVVAAAPGASCQRIYYSAPGANGLDLFVAEAVP
jgi:hypothetical protein